MVSLPALSRLLLAFAAALPLLLVMACLSNVDPGASARGNVLIVNVSNLRRVPEVAYTQDENHYVIRSSSPDRTLAVAKVLLRNNRSAQVSLFVNEKAAYLTDRQYTRFGPVDPYKQRQKADQPSPPEKQYAPFLWGTVAVPQGYQIQGWLVFEIPHSFQVEQFEWDNADSVRVPVKGAL
jgi:hypothetical protein